MKMVNDVNRALLIMNQTAAWCKRKNIPMMPSWSPKNLTREGIARTLGAKNNEFFVFELDGRDIGACILAVRDLAGSWKKYGYQGKHYYVNKLAMADEFHGGDYSKKILDALKAKAVVDGVKSIRCEANAAIAPIYINNGFFPHWSFKGRKSGKIFVRLAWYRWTPDEFETVWRGAGKFNLRRFIYRMIKKFLWFL